MDGSEKPYKEKAEHEPLRRNDTAETDESSVSEKFNKAIHSGGKQIIINDDFFLTETLTIDVDDITIDGQGHTIQASGRDTRIFVVTSNNVTLKNIIFKNGNATDEGGAINNVDGTLNLIQCKFIGNTSHESDGGAIYNMQGKINIKNCKFDNNHSNRGDGGAVFNLNGEINITGDCEFKSNFSKFGGAIYNGKTLNLKNATFKNNTSLKGLSIFNTNDATLTECNFERTEESNLNTNSEIHNLGILYIEMAQKEKIESLTRGGFIHIKSVNTKSFKYLNSLIGSGVKEITLSHDIINKEFKKGIDINHNNIVIDGDNHIIDGFGKGIFNVNGRNVTLKNIQFRNGSTFEGGAVNNKSDSLTLINCSFDCNISNLGGAISNDGSIEINECDFNKNIANETDGGAINNKGELKLINCNFTNNSSHNNGGAINNLSKLTVEGGKFKSNRTKNNGASINNAKDAMLSLHGTTFENNSAKGNGSVVYNDYHVEMEECTFSNNISTEFSNIIFQYGDKHSHLNIRSCTFSRDRFSNNLIFIENGSCDVDSSAFKLTKERENSHAIYNENGILKVKNLEFENISSEIIFNNHVIFIERNKDMEQYIKSGDKGKPFEYIL